MLDTLPAYCLDGRAFWRATVPLIYFHIVEWHHADRVLQQFGLQQGIPDAPHQDHSLHTLTLKSSSSWIQTHSYYIRVWDDRIRFVISGQSLQDPPHYHSEYMDWFRYVTRRWITRQGAELGAQADFVERVRRDAPVDTELRRFAASTQRGTREDRCDVTSPLIEPSIPPHRLPVIPDAPIDPTTLRHRRRERRHPPAPPQRPTDPMPPPVVFHPFRGHYYYAGVQLCTATLFIGSSFFIWPVLRGFGTSLFSGIMFISSATKTFFTFCSTAACLCTTYGAYFLGAVGSAYTGYTGLSSFTGTSRDTWDYKLSIIW
ncbi:serine/threonine-protein phosphatase 7 long form homolog [Mercurialis annua]|uniref:serine/threonine-protein phosphatase 7 long form homolog n=1 Tax=Mercurialis annua TaxID=3986 RepID=UPI0024AEF155|nr:serine/threonine-protein phosphatase 7 long form homolog [Mercurialis annua]